MEQHSQVDPAVVAPDDLSEGGLKLVLLALADYQGPSGICPSVASLAEKVSMSKSQTQQYIAELTTCNSMSHRGRKDAPEGSHDCVKRGRTTATQCKTRTKNGTKTGSTRRAASLPALVDPDDPDWLPREWKDFEQNRREIRKPLTPTARAQQIKRLARCKAEGHDIAAILRDCTATGYTGLFAPKPSRGNGSRPDPRAGVARSLFGDHNDDDDDVIDDHAERID